MTRQFPELDPRAIAATRDALHAYARVLGGWLKRCRPKRKHWWHASLRPSLNGLTTGVVRAACDFELELDFNGNQLLVHTTAGDTLEPLIGQSASDVAEFLDRSLADNGVDVALSPGDDVRDHFHFDGYSAEQAARLQQALAAITSALEDFRATIKEETSPIQVWPHHFDLSMIWLPGEKVPGQDSSDEEHSDKQMNFGFAFGDSSIKDPYFYVTAYPLPEALPATRLPAGTTWMSEGFSGAVLLYGDLVATKDPAGYLQELWSILLEAGWKLLLDEAHGPLRQ